MIKYDKRLEEDFLSIDWVKKLQDSGIVFDNARYWIVNIDGTYYLTNEKSVTEFESVIEKWPTYTAADLSKKLHSLGYPQYNTRLSEMANTLNILFNEFLLKK